MKARRASVFGRNAKFHRFRPGYVRLAGLLTTDPEYDRMLSALLIDDNEDFLAALAEVVETKS